MTTTTYTSNSSQTQKASETWCISGYKGRQGLKQLDRTHVNASVFFASTLNPEAPQ